MLPHKTAILKRNRVLSISKDCIQKKTEYEYINNVKTI